MSRITLSRVLVRVGAGPGDPELITVKAAASSRKCDLIFLPGSVQSGGSFVRRIVESLNLPPEKFRPVSLCMSRNREDDIGDYDRAADTIVTELRGGKSVAWLTEATSLFLQYIPAHLRGRQTLCAKQIEIIPGVSSAGAAAARCQIPAACLDDHVVVCSSVFRHSRPWQVVADQFETSLFC